jgi:hypothetical protein
MNSTFQREIHDKLLTNTSVNLMHRFLRSMSLQREAPLDCCDSSQLLNGSSQTVSAPAANFA